MNCDCGYQRALRTPEKIKQEIADAFYDANEWKTRYNKNSISLEAQTIDIDFLKVNVFFLHDENIIAAKE